MGRKKAERPTNANVATRVLAQAKAEKLWLDLIELEKRRLGLLGEGGKAGSPAQSVGAITDGVYRGNFSIIPLTNLLRYLEDRAYGRPVDTVNHVHDKPLEMNVNVKISEIIRQVRERKREYERSRA